MRLIGHMVTRNEYGRYLHFTLPHLKGLCDQVVVYDDQSDDGTLEYERSLDVSVVRRPDNEPSFAEDESWFRQQAWWEMEELAKPEPGDWILCLDADEFLIHPAPLRQLLADETAPGLILPVDEVFAIDEDQTPLVRTDGFWGQISACRLVRCEGKPSIFAPRTEGGGSVPAAWASDARTTGWLRILHYGYADPDDRLAKFNRYAAGKGHNPSHVASIVRQGNLVRWTGVLPEIAHT